jgi:hypothetical protein
MGMVMEQNHYSTEEIATPDDLKTEADYLRLWIEVWVEGIRLDESAAKGLGTEYLEDLHPLYEYDGEFRDQNDMSPWWVLLPGAPDEKAEFDTNGHVKSGLLIQSHVRNHSPYLAKREGERLFIEKNGVFIADIAFQPRPRYLSKTISDGSPVGQFVAPIGGYWLECVPLKYCYYFQNQEQCRFCNIASTESKIYSSTRQRKKTEQIAEAFAIAWEEGAYHGMSLCGGSLPGTHDQDQYLNIARAIKDLRQDWDNWNDGSVPLDYIGGAPTADDFHKIDELKSAGMRFMQFNLEVGDPAWFAALCPGKERAVGHGTWVRALHYAAEVFGKNGQVRSNMVAGVEPAATLLKAAEDLAAKGVVSVPNPWKPTPGSFLEGHRAPAPDWYFKLYNNLADVFIQSNFDFWELVDANSPRFFEYSPAFHFWRGKLGIKSADAWKRSQDTQSKKPAKV